MSVFVHGSVNLMVMCFAFLTVCTRVDQKILKLTPYLGSSTSDLFSFGSRH